MVSDKFIELQQRRGRQKQISLELVDTKAKLREYARNVKLIEQAQIIIQNVAQLTQKELQYQISDIVTLALATVFDDAYEFEVEFVVRRDKTECDLWFVKNGNRIHPIEASGGGAVDVACFALRIAMWKLSQPKTRNTLILDEPLKYLSTDLQEKAHTMIKQISKRMNIQIIMVSHVTDAIEEADKVITVSMRNGISKVS